MAILDDGDVVRGLGFVAMYAAHVEEAIDELLDALNFMEPVPEALVRAQASQKVKEIRRRLQQLPPSDFSHALENLEICGQLLEARHEVLHGRIYAQFGGPDVLEPGRPNRQRRPISSAELYELANALTVCRGELHRPLIFSIPRARSVWASA